MSLGHCLASAVKCGDCVLLEGEMGAGKSVLTRGMARGLGISGAVPSPTFTIMNIHEGTRLRLYHFDFYRLSGADEFYEAGLEEFVPPEDGVAVIEWPDLVPEVLPEDSCRIRIEHVPEGRRVVFLTEDGISRAAEGWKAEKYDDTGN